MKATNKIKLNCSVTVQYQRCGCDEWKGVCCTMHHDKEGCTKNDEKRMEGRQCVSGALSSSMARKQSSHRSTKYSIYQDCTLQARSASSFLLWFTLWPVWRKDISSEAKNVSLSAASWLSSLQEIQSPLANKMAKAKWDTIEEPKWDFNKRDRKTARVHSKLNRVYRAQLSTQSCG